MSAASNEAVEQVATLMSVANLILPSQSVTSKVARERSWCEDRVGKLEPKFRDADTIRSSRGMLGRVCESEWNFGEYNE